MKEKHSSHEDALAVVHRLRSAGYEAYFAGGCVRDALLGLEPTDYDVATNAAPTEVRSLFPRSQAVGAAFGVILVRHHKSQIEVATFRTDLKYVDGRRPEGVIFTTAEEDAKRRDFSINGLFFDPVDEKVIDFVGGQADLHSKTLRAIGEPAQRFEEDHLRLLRAVRFAARFNLTIEPQTALAMCAQADQLKRVSPERIAEELRLVLTAPTRPHAYRLLREFACIPVILRFVPQPVVPSGFFLAIEEPRLDFGAALAGLVLDARGGQPMTQPEIRKAAFALRQALKISNDETAGLEGSLCFEPLLNDTPSSVARLKRFLALPHYLSARAMMKALSRFGIMRERCDEVLGRLSELEKTEFAPVPLITGDDLTAAGLKPGKEFKLALDAAYDAQLEHRVKTKQEALDLAIKTART